MPNTIRLRDLIDFTLRLLELNDTLLRQKIETDHAGRAASNRPRPLSFLFLEGLHEVVNELHLDLPPLLVVFVLDFRCNLILRIVPIKEVLQLPITIKGL